MSLSLNDGIESLKTQNWLKATQVFVEALEQNPNHPQALEGLSQAFAGQHLWNEAITVLNRLLERFPQQPSLWEKLGDYSYHAQDHLTWTEAYQTYLSLVPLKQVPLPKMLKMIRRWIKVEEYGIAYRFLQRLSSLYHEHPQVHIALGEYHEKRGQKREAIRSYCKVVALEPSDINILKRLSSLLNQKVPTWHFPMMNDHPRNEGFLKAIESRVTPEDRVLDIGCGSGLLSMMAARAGAKAVYACESEDQVAQVAQEIIQENGYDQQIRLITKRSTDMSVGKDLPQRLDVLVCEIFDVSLLGEDALNTIRHAKEHLLEKNARIIPAKARVWCSLVESKELRDRFFIDEACGFNLKTFNQLQDPRVLQLDLKRFQYTLLTQPQVALEIDFEGDFKMYGSDLLSAEVIQSGQADGFIFWYDLILDPEETLILSTSPLEEGTHWLQGFAPCYDQQVSLTQGDFTQFMCSYQRFLLWFKHLA